MSEAPPEDSEAQLNQQARVSAPAKRSWFRNGWSFIVSAAKLLTLPVALFLTVYIWLAVRYWSQHPRLTRNFSAEMNAEIETVPEAERAWPHYRELLMQLDCHLPPEFFESPEYVGNPDPVRVRAITCTKKNHALLPRLREVAAMPKLGYMYRDASDPADLAWMQHLQMGSGQAKPASDNPLVWEILLNYSHPLCHFAQMLRLDAELAAEQNHAAQVYDDVNACLDIANQFHSQPMLLDDMASWRIFRSTTSLLGWILTEYPSIFSDQQLQSLAQRLTTYGDGHNLVPRLASERMAFDDVVQRVYSDDGQGDGIFLYHLMQQLLSGQSAADAQSKLLAPYATSQYPSRSEVVERFRRIIDDAERMCMLPLWECTELPVTDTLHAIEEEEPKYVLFDLLLPSVEAAYRAAQDTCQERDAAIVVIALIRFHLHEGSWPETLEALIPKYLSLVPPDRFSGESLKYRIVDGQPLLYSVGLDRVDDGGNPMQADCTTAWASWKPLPSESGSTASPDGDLILWPPLERPQLDKSGFYGSP